MRLFKKKEIQHLHHQLQDSFGRVKEDHQALTQWIKHLHQTAQDQQQTISQLHQQHQHQSHQLQQAHQKLRHQQQHLTFLHQTKNQPHPEHYHYLHQRLEKVSQKVDQLLEHHQSHSDHLTNHSAKLDHFHQRIQALEAPKPKHSFKEKIVQTFSRHSKSYLKNLILNYLQQHQKISALQLKDIVVDQQNLTSKSSFYRILEEIEKEDYITTIKDGKQKIFMLKTAINS